MFADTGQGGPYGANRICAAERNPRSANVAASCAEAPWRVIYVALMSVALMPVAQVVR